MACPSDAQGDHDMSTVDSSSAPGRISFERSDQIKTAIVVAAFVAVFWELLDFVPVGGLGSLVWRWVHESDWSHGPIIPLFSVYLVYLHWDRIKRCPVKYTWVGLILLLGGLGLYLYSLSLLKIGYARPVAMMITLLGVIIFLCGLPVLRYAWLPWLYLFFAIPIPRRIYFMLTDPLQRLAAVVSCSVLEVIPGLTLDREGIKIFPYVNGVSAGELSVTDACSGMRSTMVLCALGVAVAFMSPRPWWHRVVLLGSCVPIATACNAVRVAVTSLLHVYVGPKYATGTYHTALGLAVILLATGIFLGIGWALNHLFVEETGDETAAKRAG